MDQLSDSALPPPSLTRRAGSGFLWLAAGNGARAVLRVAILALLARLLEPADFGLVAAAGVVLWLSLVFSGLGLGPSLIQRPALERRHVASAVVASAGFGVVVGLLVAAAAHPIAAAFRMPALAPLLMGLAAVFPIAGLSAVAECLLQRELRFRIIAGAELASYAIGYGVAGVVFAYLGAGAWALVGAEVVKTTVKAVLFLRAVPLPRPLAWDGAALRDLLRFGSGYTASGITIYLAAQADTIIVGRFLGAGPLGVYGRAYELMLAPAQALGTILDKILFPTMSRVQAEPARLRVGYRRAVALVALLVLPASGATMVLAPEIIAVLLGSRWEGAVVPLQVLAAGMYCRVGYMVGHAVVNASGAVRAAAARSAVHAALVVAGALTGLRWGLPGVAAGVVLALTAHFALIAQLGNRVTGLSWPAFASLHLPGIALTALVVAATGMTTELLRARGMAAPVTLAAASAAAAAAAALGLRLAPLWLLGRDGMWLLDTLVRQRWPGRRGQAVPP